MIEHLDCQEMPVGTHCYVQHNSHPSGMDVTPHYRSLRLLLLNLELIAAECCGNLGEGAEDRR